MKIVELLKADKPCISCELFPPKSGTEFKNACQIVSDIATVGPSFMSVTCGAGGSAGGLTIPVAKAIQNNHIPALAHLTCVNSDNSTIDAALEHLRNEGISNILALRGDIIGQAPGDFQHASDLIKRIAVSGDFCIGGACYPEGHPEAGTLDKDIENTKIKIAAGCEFLVTQMVFDNNIMYNYMYRLLRNGIDVPVVAGIMPVTNAKQVTRICELSGTKLPPHYRAIVERFENDPEALMQAGIAYALGQIIDLIANGFKNIHVYTMNRPEIIGGIMKNLSEIVK